MSMKPPDSPQTIARQLPPTKRAIEARQGGWTDFLQGIPVLARFKKSVRVGSGTNTSFDGVDGAILANGASAQIAFAARDVPTNVGVWYYTGGKVRLFRGADLWLVDETTGQITQDTLTALTAGTNITMGVAGFANTPGGTRLQKPVGTVYLTFRIAASGAIGAGATVATVTSAHKPTGFVNFSGRRVSGGVASLISLLINSSGGIVTETALVNGDSVTADYEYYQ